MSALWPLLLKYLIGLAGISVVVLIHETGHLVMASLMGIGVEVFSFGFGPKLISTQIRGTELRLSMVPVGGYCRLKGSEDLERALRYKGNTFRHTEEGSYYGAHPAKRIATYLGGVLFNVIFAILLYALLAVLPFTLISTEARVATTNTYESLFGTNTSPAWKAGIRTGDVITALSGAEVRDWEELETLLARSSGIERFTVLRGDRELTFLVEGEVRGDDTYRWGLAVMQEAVVGSVRPSSREERAGLLAGDRIISVDDQTVENHLDLLSLLPVDGRQVTLGIERDGPPLSITFTPERDDGGRSAYRFSLASARRSGTPERFSVVRGVVQSLAVAEQTVDSLFGLSQPGGGDLHTSVTGMNRSALLIGDIASLGFEQNPVSGIHALLYLMGVVSISLAIINLFPLPAFDGGQLVMALLEWVSGKEIKPRVYLVLQIVGFVMIALFFAFLSFTDFRHALALRR